MSQVKPCTITLAVEQQDGSQCFFDLTLANLIGFSGTNPDLYLTQVAASLADNCPTILRPEEMDSLQYARLNGLWP
jgi:hypothetical protein